MKFEQGDTVVPQAPFCDVKNDKNCTLGCRPAENNPDCVINPNYVRPTPKPPADVIETESTTLWDAIIYKELYTLIRNKL